MGGNPWNEHNVADEHMQRLQGVATAITAMDFSKDGYDYHAGVKKTVDMAKRESMDRSLFEETGINPRGED
jgi:hypothetical protein